ncbi:MAG: sulfate adenylyltransferase, partial [Calditrichaeota bacterium]
MKRKWRFKVILPHGGELIDRYVHGSEREALLAEADSLPGITLDDKNISDLEMIACGAMSPLTGFMTGKDYRSVVEDMRLANGLVWSIPITLAVDRETAERAEKAGRVALRDAQGTLLAVMNIEDAYTYDKQEEALHVYRTTDEAHPGVQYVYQQGEVLLGGPVFMINRPRHSDFMDYRLEPEQTRAAFRERGWNTVVAFQTRNPIHRAHEYLQKCALEIVDGLLIHPLMGRTKSDDIPAEVRMKCYQVLLENYYPRDRVMLSVFPAAMRYAGPREAIFHALVRKNYG